MVGYSAGLLGFRSTESDDSRVTATLAVSPWRGQPTSSHVTGAGQIYALGEASSAQEDAVSIVLHGRIDRLPNADADIPTATSGHDTCLALIDAYRRDGESFVDRLTGDFALILVDERVGIMLAARDWVGTRPLFWGQSDHGPAFASEPAQVLALLGEPYRLDEEVLAEYARIGKPPLDATFALGVKAIIPGGRVIAGPGGEARSGKRALRFPALDLSRAAALEPFRERMSTAVCRRAAGAGRLGSLISGGMDSTTIAATAASLARRDRCPPLVAGFTTAYPGFAECDETTYARVLAERWSVPWHPVVIRPEIYVDWPAEGFARHLGPTFPGFAIYSQLAREVGDAGVDVLLTGDLGDAWLDQSNGELRLSILRGDHRGLLTWAIPGTSSNPRQTASQIYRGLRGRLIERERAEAFFETRTDFWMRLGLETQEREAMYRGVRIEFPYADYDLATLLIGLRPSVRASRRTKKRIVREAMRGLLPESILRRRGHTILDPWLTSMHRAATGVIAPLPLLAAAHYYADIWRSILAEHRAIGGDKRFTTLGG